LALKIVVMTREQGTGNREQGTGNREQGTGFRQLYFLLLMSVFFRSPTYNPGVVFTTRFFYTLTSI